MTPVYDFDKAQKMLGFGYRLEVWYSSKARKSYARIVSGGSVLGTLRRADRERVLNELPLTLVSREPKRALWALIV